MSLVATLEPPNLTVEPGRESTAVVRVRNRSTIVERFEITIVGPTAEWATVDPPALRLFPNKDGEARIFFRPPRAATPAADTYPFAVSILPVGDPASVTVEEGRITLAPFVELTAQVVPQTSRGSRAGVHELTIRNDGNAVAEIAVMAEQADRHLRFEVVPERLGLLPGEAGKVHIVARPVDTFLMGAAQRVPFEIKVAELTSGARPVPAALEQRPILPNWLKPAAGLAVVGALALAFLPGLLAGNGGDRIADASPSPTPLASPTPTPAPTPAPSAIVTTPPTEAPSEAPSASVAPTPGELTLAVTGDDFALGGDLTLNCLASDPACRENAELTVQSIMQALLGTYGGPGLNTPSDQLTEGTLPVRASWEGPYPYTYLDIQKGLTSSVAIDLAPLLATTPGYVYAVVLEYGSDIPRRYVVPGGVADQLFKILYKVPEAMPDPTPRPDPLPGGIVFQPSLQPLVNWTEVFMQAPKSP